MSNRIQRSALTTSLLGVLQATGKPVGDAVAPRGNVGWVGQPNADGTNFIPYGVLTPLPTGAGSGSLTEPGEDVWFNFAVTSYGVTRAQCEDMSDVLVHAAQQIRKLDVTMWAGTPDEYGRRIQTVVVTSYGAVQPIGDTDPRTYAQTDSLSLWTTG